jgi:hypothetical protein
MQSNAARRLTFIFRKQQAPFRRSILTPQSSKFLIEVLKAETEAQRLRILQKQLATCAICAGDSA